MDFFLITQPRSGTHLLTDILGNHPELSWLPLDYHSYRDEIYKILSNKPLIGEFTKTFLLQTFFNSCYKSKKTNTNVGFFTHFDAAIQNNLVYVFKRINKNLKVILLKRRNTLKQYVSCLIRQEREKQFNSQNIDFLNFEKPFLQINCNVNNFFNFYKDFEIHYIDIKTSLERYRIPFIEIYYEDLRANSKIELEKIKKLFNLKTDISPESKFFKLETRPLNEIILNFNEFYEKLKNTKFNIFFKTV